MAAITAGMVKELRERTQAGMMDCKNALAEADGDMAKAAEILAKKGKTKADNKAGKIAAQGLVSAAVSTDGRHGVVVEVNCQTDFVAMGDDFKGLLKAVTAKALELGTDDVATLEAAEAEGRTLKAWADDLTARSGEKHAIRRAAHFELQGSGLLHTYIHFGSKIAVLVELASKSPDLEAVKVFADDVALQVASMNPRYLHKKDVPQPAVDKQREIFSALMDKEDGEAQAEPEKFLGRVKDIVREDLQAAGTEVTDEAMEAGVQAHFARSENDRNTMEGLKKAAAKVAARAPAAREKILDGKVAKWLTEVVLLDQTSVKENKKTITQVQAEVAKTAPGTEVLRFARFEVGEGIEKGPTKDFAQEVAELTAQKA